MSFGGRASYEIRPVLYADYQLDYTNASSFIGIRDSVQIMRSDGY
jgi:hypothetical protein